MDNGQNIWTELITIPRYLYLFHAFYIAWAMCIYLYDIQLVECPSIYEMLGNPDFGWEKQPKIHVWRKHSDDAKSPVNLETYGSAESIALFKEALRKNEVLCTEPFNGFSVCLALVFLSQISFTKKKWSLSLSVKNFSYWFLIAWYYYLSQISYGGKKISLPFNFSILKWAIGTREIMSNAKLPPGVRFYNIYGTTFDTPFDVWYASVMLFEP